MNEKSVTVYKDSVLDYDIRVEKCRKSPLLRYRYRWEVRWSHEHPKKTAGMKWNYTYTKVGAINAARGWIFDEEWSNVPQNLRDMLDA